MRGPLFRQGEGPAAAYEGARQQRVDDRARLERITRDSAHVTEGAVTFGTPGGDERKLRGIPAIGRNVAGAIPGSSPHALANVGNTR